MAEETTGGVDPFSMMQKVSQYGEPLTENADGTYSLNGEPYTDRVMSKGEWMNNMGQGAYYSAIRQAPGPTTAGGGMNANGTITTGSYSGPQYYVDQNIFQENLKKFMTPRTSTPATPTTPGVFSPKGPVDYSGQNKLEDSLKRAKMQGLTKNLEYGFRRAEAPTNTNKRTGFKPLSSFE